MTKKITLIIALCCIAMTACKQGQTTAPKGETYYETLTVALSDRTLSTGYSAAISGVQTVEIRPQVSGMITEILIEEGESEMKTFEMPAVEVEKFETEDVITTSNDEVQGCDYDLGL